MSFDPTHPQHASVRNKLKRAWFEPANLIGVAGAFALSLALLNPIPLLVGLVAEAAYMLFVPDSKWFTKRLAQSFDQEVIDHRESLKAKVFPKLRDEVCSKVLWLESARKNIEASGNSQDPWFREALRKLDFLLEKYIQFGDKEADYNKYLFTLLQQSVDSFEKPERAKLGMAARIFDELNGGEIGELDAFHGWTNFTGSEHADSIQAMDSYYGREIASLEQAATDEAVFATKEILTKRTSVVARRREFVNRLGATLINIRHQMDLIAETFGLINDEIRARSPEQVLADIDDVVRGATTLTDTLDQLTPSDQVVTKIS